MIQSQSQKESAFLNLLTQIKLYIAEEAIQSLEYLLEGEQPQKIDRIADELTHEEKEVFSTVLANIKNSNQLQTLKNDVCKDTKVRAVFQEQSQSDESQVLQNMQKLFNVSGIVYGQNYSYPFLGLLEKMSSIYFSKSHPNPFPQPSLKMLHSLIETLFTYLFGKEIKQHYESKKGKRKKNFIHYIKEYLFYVFQTDYQKFISFNKLFKNIKSSMERKEMAEGDQQIQKIKLSQNSPLTFTKNIQELEYFFRIADEIKNQNEFKEFTKIKSLNFLYFGQKKLKQLIDPLNSFLAQFLPKDILKLISFIICRFVRKILLKCIKNKQNGKLQSLKATQHIEPIQVKIAGNQMIDFYRRKTQNFIKLDQPVDQIAKRTFLQQFFEFEYQKIIPKSILQQAQKDLLQKKMPSQNLPEYVWKNNKKYQYLWAQRIAGEQHVEEEASEKLFKRQKGKNNDYSKFIQNNLPQFNKSATECWLKYFTYNHADSSMQIRPKDLDACKKQEDKADQSFKGRKKIKLQSLSN